MGSGDGFQSWKREPNECHVLSGHEQGICRASGSSGGRKGEAESPVVDKSAGVVQQDLVDWPRRMLGMRGTSWGETFYERLPFTLTDYYV